ncbi:MAG TPA: TRAP transporter large permease subunit [Caldimonas sp.]
MSWGAAAWLLLGGSTVLLFIGLPVAFSFLVINLLGAYLWLGGEPGLAQLARNSVNSVMSFSLTPIPLFVLMGEVLFHTGLAVKVIEGIERLITQVPGRLAVVAVVAGTVFSAISGSTIATTAMLGSLSGISISKLLIGGVLPGLVLSVAFVAYIIVRVKLNPSLAPNVELVRHRGFERFKPLVLYVLPLVSIFGVVVGAMAAGWGTPTESAAVGALATVVLALGYRALTPVILLRSLKGTVSISAMILFIIVGATRFAQILSFSGASNGLAQAITGTGLPPWAVIAGMMLMLIFLGVFVDQVSMMMITLPIFMPVVQALNIDLIWFGVLFLICMQLGLLLMTMKGVAPPQVTMLHIFRAVVPFVLMSLVLLIVVFLVPVVATWLPALIG